MAQKFDLAQLRLEGDPAVVATRVSFDPRFSHGVFSVSNSGLIVYQAAGNQDDTELVWLDRQGRRIGTLDGPGHFGGVSISPQADRAVVSVYDSVSWRGHLRVYDIARGTSARLTFEQADDIDPVWSPDGTTIEFARLADGGFHLDEAGRRVHAGAPALQGGWFVEPGEMVRRQSSAADLVDSEREGRDRHVDAGRERDGHAAALHRVALQRRAGAVLAGRAVGRVRRDESVTDARVRRGLSGHRRALAGVGPGRDVPAVVAGRQGDRLHRGVDPRHSRPRRPSGAAPRFFGTPQRLFEAPLAVTLEWRYDVTRDGERFLFVLPLEHARPDPLTLVVGWGAEIPAH